MASDPAKLKQFAIGGAIGVIALAAALGSTNPDAGERLIGLVRRWEHGRAEAATRPTRRWAFRLAGLVALILLGAVPVAISKQWPSDNSPATGVQYPQLVAAARSRSALLSGEPRDICRFMAEPAAPSFVPCREWAPLAARWLRADLRLRGGLPLTASELTRLQVSDNGEGPSGEQTWGVWEEGSPRVFAGAFGPEQGSDTVWEVLLGREPPVSEPLIHQEAVWGYEVVDRGGSWTITGIEVCDWSEAEPCLRLGAIRPREWKGVLSRRPT
jgi:hypothetical protein